MKKQIFIYYIYISRYVATYFKKHVKIVHFVAQFYFPSSSDLNRSTTLKKFWSSLSRHCINQLKQLVRNCITENSSHATLSRLLLLEMHLPQFINFQESPWNNVFRKHHCIYIRLLKRRHCTDTLTTLTTYRTKWDRPKSTFRFFKSYSSHIVHSPATNSVCNKNNFTGRVSWNENDITDNFLR